MNADDVFLDTNVLIYSVVGDTAKATVAEELLRRGGTVSIQVLTEFADVAQRKYRSSWSDTLDALTLIRALCRVTDITVETHVRGLAISQRHGFRIYDGMIVAAAIIAGCTTLFSEDMQDGQVVDSVTIRNPFLSL
jgi:predicted nucleic acid-binding protein